MKPQFKRRYYFPRKLLTWKDLTSLINLRPLMTSKRVRIKIVDSFGWNNHPWALDPNCFPPTLLKDLIDKNLVKTVNSIDIEDSFLGSDHCPISLELSF